MPFYISEVLYSPGGMQNGTSLSNGCNIKEMKTNMMSSLDLTALDAAILHPSFKALKLPMYLNLF